MQNDATPAEDSGTLSEFELRDKLRELRTYIPDSPWLNPITCVAFDLSRRLESGEISFNDMKGLAGRLMDRACVTRARRLRDRMRLESHAETLAEFSQFIDDSATPDGSGGVSGAPMSLEQFAKHWERARVGIVLTAHPTFGSSKKLVQRMVEIAAAPPTEEAPEIGVSHRPDPDISLQYEHECAQDAILHLRNSYEELMNSFYATAANRYGDAAYKITPKLATFASWVGYDLDGRMDITWIASFRLKLQEKHAALTDIRARFLIIKHRLDEQDEAQRLTRQIIGKLDLAIASVDKQRDALANVKPDGEGLADAANVITGTDSYNLVSVKPITDMLDELIDEVNSTQEKRQIASLSALISATGLGMSHIHVRINAAQLDNALRAYVQEAWTSDLSEGLAVQRIREMIENANLESVNFGTLELESATAIRQFALIAQIKKHVDAETPLRFLIAECESPASVLIAVFFAKLFGVDDIADISPLFETPSGLERGSILIEHLLEEKVYRNYVTGRGRMCIQTGFSDAGRFIGQVAATLAIERLDQAVAELVKKAGLDDVEVLIFSTHGESMGRGAHPGGLRRRLRYVLPHETRRRFERLGLSLKHETSFQGGDGYMFFATRELTTRSLATIVQDGLDIEHLHDPFYDDENLGLDFYLRVRSYQQDLFSHEGYRALLGAFGPNLLFKTGSRAVKRQSETATAADRGNPANMRAIPNNAILQQFGYIANVVSGLGEATKYDRDHFISIAKNSARLRTIFEMVAMGKQLSSLNAMGANAYLFDAGFWASRASWGREPELESAFRTISRSLLSDNRAAVINGLMHHLRIDAIDLHAILETQGIEGGKIPDDTRLELDLLQAIRLALIMRIFIIAARLPKFAPRNEVSPGGIVKLALSLDIPEVLSFMRSAFPHTETDRKDGSFLEGATYRPHGIDDYARLEQELLTPMEEAYEFVREIGTGISHHFGAFG